MKERKPLILFSEPVREIMGNPPARIIRTGTTVIFILFILLVVFSWVIRYPDVIPSPVEITTSNPPVTLVSKITGHIKYLYVKDKEKVTAGQLIAVMETTALVEEIEKLSHILDTMQNPGSVVLPDFSHLGEIQEYYATFRKNQSDLKSYLFNDYYGSKIISINQEIKGIKEYIEKLKVKEKYFAENQRIEMNKFRRDSGLFIQKIIPESQLEISRQEMLKNSIDLQQVRLDYSERLIELSQKEQLLQDYKINRKEEREKLESVLGESFLNLKAQMNIWVNTYYLKSDIEGTATFTKYWSANQSVEKDEAVFSVVPVNQGEYVGRINLRMQRSGKVKEGQQVNIKLSSYPYLEYGMVKGVVKSKSLVPSGDAYIIEIALPHGLTTIYDKKLEFTQNMQGIAEIITEDQRLLQKIINPFRHMIAKNRR
jgi:HlyD family secretion protein